MHAAQGGKILDIGKVVADARACFDSGRTRPLEWRIGQLEALDRMVRERQEDIHHALATDLGKPALEAYIAETSYVRGEIDLTKKKLRSWAKPERVWTTLTAQPGSSFIYREPLGVVLVIGPWNYPFQLVVAPLIGALAAGNTVVLKPSEVSAATSAMLARWIPEYLDRDAVRVVEGGVPETTALLAERFDHIFYTGNGGVGRIVMEAAAKHLTPVTLELGGKSPCIVDRDAALDVTARRIVFGKFYNAGQTCIAPDYVLCHEAVHDALVDRMKAALLEFFGPDPKKSPDYGRIINARHVKRLAPLIGSGRVAVGGEVDEAERYIAPTILTDVAPDSPVMADEIFGPVLPVLKVKNVDAAIAAVNARPKPLALYVFTESSDTHERVLSRTSSGGATVNHVWLHFAVHGLPFGGVGASGMGAYHGRASFETFSHRKGVLKKPTSIDPKIMYPPYDDAKVKWIKRLM